MLSIWEKPIGEGRRCPSEAIGVADILQVLEGAALNDRHSKTLHLG